MKKKARVETTTLNVVPEDERKSWVSVMFIQSGVYICVPCLMLGGILVSSMPLKDALISGVLGYLISALIMSMIGIIGSDLGRPTAVIAQSSFGKNGSRLVMSLVFALSSFGWFAVQNVVCGQAFSSLLKDAFGIAFPVSISILFWGLIMLTTAVQGIDGLKMLNRISVPLLFAVFLFGLFMALSKFGTESLGSEPTESSMSIVQGTMLTLSFLASGMTTAPDLTRYQKSRGNVFASSFLGLCPAGIILLTIGAVLTKLTGEYDISIVLTEAGVPALGLIALVLATWTTNTNNAYCGGISLVMFLNLEDNKRAIATLIAGVIGTILALLGLANQLETFIDLLGVFFFPISGIMLVDYWLIMKGNPDKWCVLYKVRWPGFIAWIAGIIVTYYAPFGLVVGFILSGVLYYGMYRFRSNLKNKISDKEAIK